MPVSRRTPRTNPRTFLARTFQFTDGLENPRKNTVVKKQKNSHSAYPQSDGVRSEKQWECKDLQKEQGQDNNEKGF